MARNTTKAGGGINSRVNREVGNRYGNRASIVNPRSVSQIGSSIGNKSTETGKVRGNPTEVFYQGRKPAGGPGGVPLGNEIATNVGGGGPGKGRNLWGKSGTNCVTGPVNPGVPENRPRGRDTLAGE